MKSAIFRKPRGKAAGTVVAVHWGPAIAARDATCRSAPAPDVASTVADTVAALRADDRLVTGEPVPVSVTGDSGALTHNGLSLDLELDRGWTGTCSWSNDQPAVLLLSEDEVSSHLYGIEGTERVRATVIEIDTVIVWIAIYAPDRRSFDAAVTEATPLIDTFSFMPWR